MLYTRGALHSRCSTLAVLYTRGALHSRCSTLAVLYTRGALHSRKVRAGRSSGEGGRGLRGVLSMLLIVRWTAQ